MKLVQLWVSDDGFSLAFGILGVIWTPSLFKLGVILNFGTSFKPYNKISKLLLNEEFHFYPKQLMWSAKKRRVINDFLKADLDFTCLNSVLHCIVKYVK